MEKSFYCISVSGYNILHKTRQPCAKNFCSNYFILNRLWIRRKQNFHGIQVLMEISLLTLWGRDKMAAIFQTIFSNEFSWMKMYEFRLRFHWSLFIRVQLTTFQHWFRSWLGADQASHYLNQWWLVYWRIYVSPSLNELTLSVRGPSYLGLTRSISWLLMPWLLTSPGHQQSWYWLCRIGRFVTYLRTNFNYLCHINVE